MNIPRSARTLLKTTLPAILNIGGRTVHQSINKKSTTITLYHGITKTPSHHVPEHLFKEQLDYYEDKYNVISIEEYCNARQLNKQLPNNSLIITFDDGCKNLTTRAFPHLKRKGFPASIFLTTKPTTTGQLHWFDKLSVLWEQCENNNEPLITPHTTLTTRQEFERWKEHLKTLPHTQALAIVEQLTKKNVLKLTPQQREAYKPLSWNDVRKTQSDILTYHPHTHTHPILSRLSPREQEQEITISINLVEKYTGITPTIFAYPNGRKQDYTNDTITILKRHGITNALTTIPQLATPRSPPYELPRTSMGELSTMNETLIRLHTRLFL